MEYCTVLVLILVIVTGHTRVSAAPDTEDEALIPQIIEGETYNNDNSEVFRDYRQSGIPEWSQWTDGPCVMASNSTCGTGVIQRRRTCSTGVNSDCESPGESWWGFRHCNIPCVIEWTSWATKSECSHTCGQGFVERVRNCSTGNVLDCHSLPGRWWEVSVCNNGECPYWLEWAGWSACSETCGSGTAARFRKCSTGTGADCSGKYYEINACNDADCPTSPATTTTTTTTTKVPAVWSTWAEVVQCSKTCGGGFHQRLRNCSTGDYKDCAGKYWSIDVCNAQSCAVDGAWSAWSDWNACPVTCGTSSVLRSRSCDFPDPDNKGLNCPGDANETKSCDQGICPVDGQWGAWGGYTPCSLTCDEGQQTRNRSCHFDPNAPHGNPCPGSDTQTKKCTQEICKGDGFWEEWSGWSRCTKSCGSGLEYRARLCEYPPNRPQGEPCTGTKFDSRPCNTDICPANGTWTAWASWSQCSHSCGGGRQQRTRVCMFPPDAPHENDCEGSRSETQDCSLHECPVDGSWGGWLPWAQCSTTCGGGSTTRHRSCSYPSPTAPHGKNCVGRTDEQKNCSLDLCPVDATWSLWSTFSSCSVTCGGGTRTQNRTCQYDPVAPLGQDCTGSSISSQPCNNNQCPVDGRYLEWASWSDCTVSCANGTQYRTRQCFFAPDVPHGNDCQGPAREDNFCNDFPCPTTTTSTTTTTMATVDGHWADWTEWTDCTTSCGGGTVFRKRLCTYPDHTLHGQYCPGDNNQTQACNTNNCPVDGHWSNWSLFGRCSVSCGDGTNTRTRDCLFDPQSPHGDNCTGANTEDGPCYAGPCPVDGVFSSWSTWTSCPVTCGGGVQGRQRTCDYPDNIPHGQPCQGETHQNQTCNNNLCPVDGTFGDWTTWTACPVTCGNGTQTRNRTCNFKDGYPHGNDCVGEQDQIQFCNTNLCPVDGHYSEWHKWKPCPVTCGGGIQERNRDCIYDLVAPHGAICPGSPTESQLCGLNACPMDGHWTAWSTWTQCSTSCADGIATRYRTCTYMDNYPHGTPCPGEANGTQSCNVGPCPVDGQWSAWAAWSQCSVTCGNGTATRDRTCDFPDNIPHGNNCTGIDQESQICGTNLCPVDGAYGAWTVWSTCTTTCGGGSQFRTRPCEFDPVAPHGKDCMGSSNQTYTCNIEHCPVDGVWTNWGDYTACPVTCGGGTKYRTRQCHFDVNIPHGNDCPGNNTENMACNSDACPVDGNFTDWSSWTPCTLSCGNGTQTRDRTCYFPPSLPHGNDCVGDYNQTQFCNVDRCPINGLWSEWTAYTPCTTSCANGTHTRNRTCVFDPDAPHGAACFGPDNETSSCNPDPCPVDGTWGQWTSWDQCTATCGTGQQGRVRHCDFPDNIPHGSDCVGTPSELQDCNKNLCPVDGKISDWVPWTQCSTTCGQGNRYRSRQCEYLDGVPHGSNCTETRIENQSCEIQLCPVDGIWSSWNTWETCSVTCGGGTRARNRTCDYKPNFPKGENCTGESNQSESCNTELCPVDGVWSAWSDFSACTKSCGNGTSTRTRTCNYTPSNAPHGTACPGSGTDVISCNDTECPQDAVWSSWAPWSDCSVTCEDGQQTRNRSCDWPSSVHGDYCTGNTTDVKACNPGLCPIDGVWTTWGNWSDCSTTCDRGHQVRQRTCEFDDKAPHGTPCAGNPQESRDCNQQNLCKVDGQWAPWGVYGLCSTTCGDGTTTRRRNCVFIPDTAPHGADCPGNTTETSPCNGTTPCPVDGQWDAWTAWSKCSVTCGSGQRSRDRTCVFDNSKPHGHDCFGPANETASCNDGLCKVDGHWGSWKAWSICDVTCGGGTRTRGRDCEFDPVAPHGRDCHGEANDYEKCNEKNCPVDGVWTHWLAWGSCDKSCGGGIQTRIRTCRFPTHDHGSFCVGQGVDQQNCNTDLCSVDGVWSAWSDFSACTKSCGNGTSTRTRTCDYTPPNAPHGTPCPGSSSDIISCNDTECPQDAVWSSWGPWSDCSVTCEEGQQTRNRSCDWPSNVHGDYCTGNTTDVKACHLPHCPVDGVWSTWSDFSACTKSCGNGTATRTRTCDFTPPNAPHGTPCPGSDTNIISCNDTECPQDAVWSSWGPWSDCSVTCEDGQQTRNRSCDWPSNVHGDFCIGNATDYMACHLSLCPVDGQVSPWSDWSSCTVSCGGGTHSRSRTCEFLPPLAPHGNDCTEPLKETGDCNTKLCPRHCYLCDPNFAEYCADATVDTECPEDKRYCINTLVNSVSGDAAVDRKCGTKQECVDGWVLLSSTNDKCVNYNQEFSFTYDFTCDYCCDSDLCNERVNPPVKYNNRK